VARNTRKILMGTGIFSQEYVSEFMQKISLNDLGASSQNIINDMDRVADILFRR